MYDYVLHAQSVDVQDEYVEYVEYVEYSNGTTAKGSVWVPGSGTKQEDMVALDAMRANQN